MGRAPCCSKVGLHKGPWTPREDALLAKYIQAHGEGQWKSLPKKAGLLRCGKSCRLRWMNYLRPDIKRGNITPVEDDLIIRMHSLLGNKWSLIAGRLPGRTDNEIKNYWNTHLNKKVKSQGSDLKDQEQQEEGPSSKKKNDGNKKRSNNNNNQKKQNKKVKKSNNKGSNNEEPQKTQVYLPKPIRIKPSSLPRTEDSTTFTFDSNNSSSPTSASTSQEEKEELENNNIPKSAKDENMLCEVGNNNNLEENDGFGFFCDDYDLVNNSDVECRQSCFATDHGTLEKLYEEYLQLLNMEDNMFELDSFAESLMV